MPLHGTFDTIQLADVVQWIHGSRISGILSVAVETEETYLVFENGDLAAVGSDDSLRLDPAQTLLARGVIDAAALQAALAGAGSGGGALALLVDDGRVDAATAAAIQVEHVFETVLDLFFHEEGSFHLSTSPASSGLLAEFGGPRMNALPEPIPTAEMLVEAMRRIDDWRRFRVIMPSAYTVVRGLEGDSENPVWRELRRIGEPLSVGALCLRMPLSRYDVHRLLFEAHQQGIMAVDQLGGGEPDHTHLGPVGTLIESARVLMDEQQFDEAREVLSTVGSLDPDATEARLLLRDLRQTQLAYLYEQIPPHRVPVVNASREQLATMDLAPREAYLVSRLTGRLDVATLVVATPLGEIETLRILRKLLHAGVARLT
ncbi:MAG TPA: DUF4388 domain-containing protein [Phycisphaerae bacterium]|nr:DUF4388 domain-containing protein [Phycisphaerae bacterium]